MSCHLSDSNWHGNNESDRLKASLLGLLADWGAFLDLNLYREALLHLLDGPESGLIPIPIQIEDKTMGIQKMCLLSPEQAWHISAVRTNQRAHENQIRRLFQHTSLTFIHWINLNHREITLKSFKK